MGDARVAVLQRPEILEAGADQRVPVGSPGREDDRAGPVHGAESSVEEDGELLREAVDLVHAAQLWRESRDVGEPDARALAAARGPRSVQVDGWSWADDGSDHAELHRL